MSSSFLAYKKIAHHDQPHQQLCCSLSKIFQGWGQLENKPVMCSIKKSEKEGSKNVVFLSRKPSGSSYKLDGGEHSRYSQLWHTKVSLCNKSGGIIINNMQPTKKKILKKLSKLKIA